MTLESYARFLELQGTRSIRAGDILWVSVGMGFYQAFPVHRPTLPDRSQCDRAFWSGPAVGVRFCAPPDSGIGHESFVYLIDQKGYDVSCLSANHRSKIRRGLARSRIEPIEDARIFVEKGWPLNAETLSRQGRFRPSEALRRWRCLASALGQVDGLRAWGAWVEGELAAIAVTFQLEDCVNLLILRSALTHRSAYPNDALVYTIAREALSRPEVSCVSYGEESILGLDTLDSFKTGLGFEKRPVRQVLLLHPLLRWLKPLLLSRTAVRTAARFAHVPTARKIMGAIRLL